MLKNERENSEVGTAEHLTATVLDRNTIPHLRYSVLQSLSLLYCEFMTRWLLTRYTLKNIERKVVGIWRGKKHKTNERKKANGDGSCVSAAVVPSTAVIR